MSAGVPSPAPATPGASPTHRARAAAEIVATHCEQKRSRRGWAPEIPALAAMIDRGAEIPALLARVARLEKFARAVAEWTFEGDVRELALAALAGEEKR